MDKKILVLFFCIAFLSCNENKNIYNKNLSHFKNLIIDINTFFLDPKLKDINISDYYTNDFTFYSYPVGFRKGVESAKVDYINSFQKMKDMDMKINIVHSIYLPGINEYSHDLDGSVRVYYGAIISIEKDSIEFSGYQTVNFKQGKISAIWEWADYGGINNHINQLN